MDYEQFKKLIDLEGFLIDHGYSIKKDKSTRRSLVYTNGQEHIIITRKRKIKLYFCAEDASDRGSIIDFLYHRPMILTEKEGNIYKRITSTLLAYLNYPDKTTSTTIMQDYDSKICFNPKQYISYSQRFTNDFNYLRQRGISNQTLHSPNFANIGLAINLFNIANIAFPLYNIQRQLVGLDLRNYNYKRFAAGTDKPNGLFLSNFLSDIEEIITGESPIDLLSFHQMFRPNKKNILYVSTGGVLLSGQIEHLLQLIQEKLEINPNLILTFAFDRDMQGMLYTNRLLVSIIEQKVLYPVYDRNLEKRFCKLYNIQLREKIESSGNENFRIENREHGYDLILKNQEDCIDSLNSILLTCITQPTINAIKPNLKDFNDDLQFQNKKDILFIKKKTHKGLSIT